MKSCIITFLAAAGFILASYSGHADVSVTALVSFTGTNGARIGANPQAELIQGADGNFYGTTEAGGSNNFGTVFCMAPNGAFTNLISFASTNGANPYGGLVQVGNFFYGTTRNGGSNNLGTVFKVTTGGILTTLATFNGTNGSAPLTALLPASNGYLYGTTFLGGVSNSGTIFQMNTNGALNVLVSFLGGTNGDAPESGLIQGIDGSLYGTTLAGGNLFQAKTNGALTNLYLFPTGAQPRGKLVQDTSGFLYGTTYAAGNFNKGAAFKITTNGVLIEQFTFDGTNASYPCAGMILATDGNLYGTTQLGGSPPLGSLFQLSTNGAFVHLYFFDYNQGNATFPHGAYPLGELVQAADGNFYGTAEYGGASDFGTIFKMSLQPVFQSVSQANHLINFSWSAISNETYQLNYKTNLGTAVWQNLGNPILATNGTMSSSDNPGTNVQRFYRLQLLP